MTIVINLGLHGGRIGGIFITGIFGNFYTKRMEFLTFKTGIPGGLETNAVRRYVKYGRPTLRFTYLCQ